MEATQGRIVLYRPKPAPGWVGPVPEETAPALVMATHDQPLPHDRSLVWPPDGDHAPPDPTLPRPVPDPGKVDLWVFWPHSQQPQQLKPNQLVTDQLLVRNVGEGTEPGTWRWPPRTGK